MDISEYLPMFLAEGREHLQELNLAVVRIEEQPDDPETVDEIFRIAHSLKGMSATMGFAGMAALTHEMEDVFELLRQRKGGLEREAVTALLRCLDALGEAVEAIDATGEERIVPEPLIAELRDLVRDRTPGQEADRTGGPVAAVAPAVEAVADRRVVRIDVQLADEAQMPAVRAYMVLSALEEKGELVELGPHAGQRRGLRRPRDPRLARDGRGAGGAGRARRRRAGRRRRPGRGRAPGGDGGGGGGRGAAPRLPRPPRVRSTGPRAPRPSASTPSGSTSSCTSWASSSSAAPRSSSSPRRPTCRASRRRCRT